MMSLEFSTGSAQHGGKSLMGGLLELENAVLVLLWEGGEPRLGSLTVTLPGRASSQLLGDRDQLLGRLIGERLAERYGKMVLVSTNLSPGTAIGAGRALLELAGRLAGMEGT